MWKDLLTLSRGEQRGLIVLLLLLLMLILLRFGLSYFDPVGRDESFGQDDIVLLKPESGEIPAASAKAAGMNLSVFDPNDIGYDQLVAFGIPARISHNWSAYLKAGGHFRSPQDVGKIYGMNDSLLQLLLPYIKMDLKPESKPQPPKPHYFDLNKVDSGQLIALGWDSCMIAELMTMREELWFPGWYADTRLACWTSDSLDFIRLSARQRYSRNDIDNPPLICINSADETQWMELPGIGETYSRRIVAYRNLLGGFVSVDQIAEVYGISEDNFNRIKQYLVLDTVVPRRINVNKATVAGLRRHPYIDFFIASEIVERRKALKHINNIAQLDSLENIDSAKWELLKYYLCTE